MKKRNNIQSFFNIKNIGLFTVILALLLSITFINSKRVSAETEKNPNLGTWQMLVDGKSGEGGFFYRMNFNANGKVSIIKQFGGNNIEEEKSWEKQGDKLIIKSSKGDKVTELDNSNLTFTNKNTITYSNGFYNSVFKPYKNGLAIINWIMILLVLILLNEIFRRFKKISIIFYFVLPIVLIPLWSSYGVTYWFKWVKVYSVVLASVWFILMRFTKLGNYKFAKLIAALFLAVNIGEAVTQDFSMGYLPNVLNGIAGVLSIATLFYGWKEMEADNSKEKDLIWSKMTLFWIIAYDIWNWVFVYLNFPGSASGQFMVLLSCTIPAIFIKKGTWLQARGFTLAAWFMYYFTFPRFTESMQLMVPRNYMLMLSVAIISIAANGIYGILYLKRVFSEKRALQIPRKIGKNS